MAKHRDSIKPRVRFRASYVVNVKIHSPANSNGTNDPATWDAASYEAHPVDALEPLEPTVSEYQAAARKMLGVLRGLDTWMCKTHSGKPPTRWIAASIALGLPSALGRSETSFALEMKVTRACVSKSVIAVLQLTGLEEQPAWGLKPPAARKLYRRTNGRKRRKPAEAAGGPDLSVVDSGT